MPGSSVDISKMNGNGKSQSDNSLPLSVGVSQNFDLGFSDDKGNVVMGIKNGHIVTKNFDSSKVGLAYDTVKNVNV